MESERCQGSETTDSGEVEHEKNHPASKGTASAFPLGNSLPSHQDFLCEHEGFWYPIIFLDGVKWIQNHFKAQASDIILSSAPKSGTTWLKALAFTVLTRTRHELSSSPLLSTMPHDCVPFLEVDKAQKGQYQELPLLSTHLPYSALSNSISPGCKIVYVCRDPKDAFVSYWYSARRAKVFESLPLDVMFEQFCRGISAYGPYWDHILGYWKASLDQPERVLFLKYEDMKRETPAHVKRLAESIGHPFDLEEERKGVVERIVELCSFENLSNLKVNIQGKHREGTPLAIKNNTYFRKGEVGDWKNHLTAEMARHMDRITEQKLGSWGLKLNDAPEPLETPSGC